MVGRVTLSDVARAAGVSLATASRAVNGSTTRVVRADLREQVLAAAAALGYTPDANAQAMAHGRTTSLGLVVHDIADPYYASIAAAVTLAADARGLLVSLADTRCDPAREIEIVDLLDRQRVVAVLLAGARLGDADQDRALAATLDGYLRHGGRVALVGQPLNDLPVVRIDNAAGATALARRLVELGYRRFGLAAGPPNHRTSHERMTAIRLELARLSLPVPDDLVVHDELTRAGGRAAAARLLGRPTRTDVIMAATDLMAVGVLSGAREAGFRVPRDLAVSGYDDIEAATDVTPTLTTVRLPLAQIGEMATALALESDPGASSGPIVGEVVVRDSTPQRG